MRIKVCTIRDQGFSLVEIMIALCVISFGLLAVGQLLYIAAGSNSLARSKSAAALAAQNVLESLEASYGQNPMAADLAIGRHGPRTIEVSNPEAGTLLNRFYAHWIVESVPDPRPGRNLKARQVRATVTPVQSDGSENSRPGLNKILNVSTLFSQRMP